MTHETVPEIKNEIKELQLSLRQTSDEGKRNELKLQILVLQGDKLKTQISGTLYSSKLRKAGAVYDQTHKPRVDID